MSTNNNHFSRSEKETKPKWKSQEDSTSRFMRLSGSKLQERVSNKLSECNAVTLSERGIKEIVDMDNFSTRLRRLDLSKNNLGRLSCFQMLTGLSMLNVSENELQGDSSLDELRYLTELRTLNISKNPKIKGFRSHVIKPISKLQALIATQCGLSKLNFLRYCQELNTLILSKNEIKNWIPSEVGALEKLQKISLGYNRLEVVPDFHLCVSLSEIRLNGNFIEEIDDRFVRFASSRIKTLDLSTNKISHWEQVEKLSAINTLTNLGIKGNPLPTPPVSTEELAKTLKEDLALSTGKVASSEEQHARQYVLVIFQRQVGKEKKTFEQLIVLDQKRVKVKWTQGGAGQLTGTKRDWGGLNNPRNNPQGVGAKPGTESGSPEVWEGQKRKKKRGKKPELAELGTVLSGDASESGAMVERDTSTRKPAAMKAMEVSQMDSGVVMVDSIIRQKDKGKDRKRKKSKVNGDKDKLGADVNDLVVGVDKAVDERGSAEKGDKGAQSKVPFTCSSSPTPKVAAVGVGGESAWD